MRNPYDALHALRACAQEFDPARVIDTINERLRGGLPASSMSDGRGSAETPEPELDDEDRDRIATLDAYRTAIDQLASDALALRKMQRDVLYRHIRPHPKSKEFVRADLKAAADEYDRTHDLEVGTTWAKEQFQPPAQRIEWCQSCSRIKAHFCPVAKAKRGGKEGVLCNWCINHRDGEKWPPLEHVRAHAEGRPVRMKVRQ